MKRVTKIAAAPTAVPKLRVAAYCRVSTDSDAQLESLDSKKDHIEAINTNITGDVSKLSEPAKLLRFAEQSDMLQAFDEMLFASFVDHISDLF